MPLKNKLIKDNSGGVIILVAVSFSLLMIILGITVDIGRTYAVQSKLQNASDAALLGAVATASTTNAVGEGQRLFNTNYPAGYMGCSPTGKVAVKQPAQGQYTLTTGISCPTTIMKLFGTTSTTVNILSRVNVGYQLASPQTLELALVFDNSGVSDTASMAAAGDALTTILFNGAGSLANVNISVLPYDTAVDIGNTQVAWIQNAFKGQYNQDRNRAGGGKGFISNRNNDAPPNALVDVTDVAPTTNATRFRVPHAYGAGLPFNPGFDQDYVSTNQLAQMQFGLNSNAAIQAALATMKATGGNARSNVGLMWGWFSLSPNWQGLFSAGLPGLPAADNVLNSKQLVLVVTGKNAVYTGQVVAGQAYSNDDNTTLQLCQAIQSRGIQIYTVGFGAPGSYNQALLQQCATSSTYYFPATNSTELTNAFKAIADDIQYSTIRLSQ